MDRISNIQLELSTIFQQAHWNPLNSKGHQVATLENDEPNSIRAHWIPLFSTVWQQPTISSNIWQHLLLYSNKLSSRGYITQLDCKVNHDFNSWTLPLQSPSSSFNGTDRTTQDSHMDNLMQTWMSACLANYGCWTAQVLFLVHMIYIWLISMYLACSQRLIHLNFDFTK